MKIGYWYLDKPDDDDGNLADAIEEGTVPPDCRLGGSMLSLAASSRVDPCTICPVDDAYRLARCHGRLRPSLPGQEVSGTPPTSTSRAIENSAQQARKVQRVEWLRALTSGTP